MKKYFVVAILALVTVFAVSCNRDKKIDLVGHTWSCHENIDTLDAQISLDLIMAFNDADSVDATTSIVTPDRTETTTVRRAYTWDGEKYLVFYRTNESTRTFTYKKKTEEFYLPLDQIEGGNNAQLIALTGLDTLVFKKVK